MLPAVTAAIILLALFAWNGGIIYKNIHDASYYNQLALSATKDNPLGLEARVVHFRDSNAVSCPSSPCGPHPGWALKLVSDKPAWLLSYGICSATFCSAEERADSGGYSVIASTETSGLDNNSRSDLSVWAGYVIRWDNMQDGSAALPWKAGDMVHVIVKATPAVMVEKNNIGRWEPVGTTGVGSNSDQQRTGQQAATVIDLGETRIIDVQYGP